MEMEEWNRLRVDEPDTAVFSAVKKRWDQVAKPLDGMGRFEEYFARIGAIQGCTDPDVADSAVLVFCADNGIVREGVSQSGQEVTRACAVNLGRGQTSVCVMARRANVRVVPVDIGIALPEDTQNGVEGSDGVEEKEELEAEGALKESQEKEQKVQEAAPEAALEESQQEQEKEQKAQEESLETLETMQTQEALGVLEVSLESQRALKADHIPGVLNRKVASGTKDFLKAPAMTWAQADKAIRTGIELVRMQKDAGARILGIGELGIGNTTTSACVAAALLGCDPVLLVGRGAGLSGEGLKRKREVVALALEKWNLRKGAADPMTVLCTVGGLDIAGMAGACIGGARYHVPIILDGVISMTAALTAQRLVPGVQQYLIPSHTSREPAAKRIQQELGLSPVLDAGMALGEGTGAVMMLSLLQLAGAVYYDGIRFETSGVEEYHRF